MRTWGSWERSNTLSPGNAARVQEVLGPYLAGTASSPASPLASISDAQLLAEIAARFDRGRARNHGTATTRAGASPAPVLDEDPSAAEILADMTPRQRDEAQAIREAHAAAQQAPRRRRKGRS